MTEKSASAGAIVKNLGVRAQVRNKDWGAAVQFLATQRLSTTFINSSIFSRDNYLIKGDRFIQFWNSKSILKKGGKGVKITWYLELNFKGVPRVLTMTTFYYYLVIHQSGLLTIFQNIHV